MTTTSSELHLVVLKLWGFDEIQFQQCALNCTLWY